MTSGATTALAFVCLIHYLWHLFTLRRVKFEKRQVEQELSSLVSEITDIQSDRTLVRMENHILREIVSQTDSELAIQMLLRRFIINPRKSWGVLVERRDGKVVIKAKRGLSEEPRPDFVVAHQWWKRLKDERVIVLDGAALLESEWLVPFSSKDRGRISELFLIAVGSRDEVSGVLISTVLYPPGVSREQQIELATRLMISVSSNVKRSQDLESQKIELLAAKEMLDLRRVTDRSFESPMKMTEDFLSALTRIVGADRGALYFSTNTDSKEFTPEQARIRCGIALQPNLEPKWQSSEDRIAQHFAQNQEDLEYNHFDLVPIGVDSLIREAVVAPLKQPHGVFGLICLSKRSPEPFEAWQKQLIVWACEHLSETMLRSLSFVAVERQARLDGLTQLSNRHTFDKMFMREIDWADRFKQNCSLILLDLDRFKLVNDTYGHQAGDDVLRSAAKILRDQIANIRCGDRAVMARYGGEELGVILPGIGAAGATRIADAIRIALESTPIATGKGNIQVTASLGTSTYPDHAQNVEGMIAAADAALYHAKETGRNRVCQASEALVH
ncbi:MAG: diguanylate cyclase [Planctomycetaceae bacterium]